MNMEGEEDSTRPFTVARQVAFSPYLACHLSPSPSLSHAARPAWCCSHWLPLLPLRDNSRPIGQRSDFILFLFLLLHGCLWFALNKPVALLLLDHRSFRFVFLSTGIASLLYRYYYLLLLFTQQPRSTA